MTGKPFQRRSFGARNVRPRKGFGGGTSVSTALPGAPARLVREPLDAGLDPFAALRLLRGRDRAFALAGEWAGGGAVLGCDPVAVAAPDDDPFALLDRRPEVEEAVPGAVGGGWFGYLGYGLGARVERLPPAPPRPVALPPFSLAFYDHVLRLEAGGQWWFEALSTPDREQHLRQRLDALREAMAAPGEPPHPFDLGAFRPRPGRAAHARAVEWCRRYIEAGDLYQANLCLRLEADIGGDPLDLFATAAAALAPSRAAYVSGPWGALASLSPELFLRRAGRTVTTEPIKGTHVGREALAASAKDRAENVMIVDLMRNDLGRSCEFGSVRVPALAVPRRGPGVWHLVSEVAGTVREGVGDGELVRAAFPPGSVTGAPKIKAMAVISELESTAREAYTGAIGFASPVAGLELSVAIRTFECAGGRVWLGAGGGITWGSDPDAEYRECIAKAQPLVDAAGGRIEEPSEAAAAPLPPTRRPRPDPARGVFETILALDGDPLLAEEHLQRLARSVAELYGTELPAGIDLSPPDGRPWRIRVVALPDGSVTVEHQPATMFPEAALELRPLVLPGGLGPHKWADRSLLAAPEPLVIDLTGELLETGSGNLFVVEDGRLLTPPADGRILEGVTRGLLLRQVSIEPIDIARARAADELFVTSAIRGVQPVGSAEGIGEWRTGPVTRAVARMLGGVLQAHTV